MNIFVHIRNEDNLHQFHCFDAGERPVITKTHNTFACSVAYMEGLHFVLQQLVHLHLRSRYLIHRRTFSNLVEKASYIQH